MRENLRVLYCPLWTNRGVERCSTWNWAKVYFTRLLEQNPKVYLYFPVMEGSDFDFDGLLKHPRVKAIPMYFKVAEHPSFKQIDEMSEIQARYAELFADFLGRYYIDAVIVDKPQVLVPLKNIFSSPYITSCVPPVFIANVQYAIGADTHKKFQDSLFMAQSMGLAQADVISFVNGNSKGRALKYARKHLAPSYVKRIMERSHHYLNGVNIDRVLKFKAEKEKLPWTVSYGYGLNRVYRFEDLFEIFDKLFQSGRDVKVKINSNSDRAFGFNFDKYRQHFEVKLNCPQEEFYQDIASAHAFLFMATEFEMSYSACEKSLLGLVGVFLDSKCARNILYDGYPYLCKGKAELATCLRHVLENYWEPEVQDVIRKQNEFIYANYNGIANADQLTLRIREAAQARDDWYSTQFKGKKELAASIFKDVNECDYPTFLRMIKDGTDNGVDILTDYGRYAISRTVWRHCMEAIGFEDTCETEDPYFRRVREYKADDFKGLTDTQDADDVDQISEGLDD